MKQPNQEQIRKMFLSAPPLPTEVEKQMARDMGNDSLEDLPSREIFDMTMRHLDALKDVFSPLAKSRT